MPNRSVIVQFWMDKSIFKCKAIVLQSRLSFGNPIHGEKNTYLLGDNFLPDDCRSCGLHQMERSFDLIHGSLSIPFHLEQPRLEYTVINLRVAKPAQSAPVDRA